MLQDVYKAITPNIERLLELDKYEEAITLMGTEIAPISPSLKSMIISLKGDYTRITNKQIDGLLTDEQFDVQRKRLKPRIEGVIKRIPSELETLELMSSLTTIYQTPTADTLEKIQGPTNTLVPMSWVYKAIEVSKSVCQVKREDGTKGTGWLLEGGWMLTNHHVLPSKKFVETAVLVFDYEEDLHGGSRETKEYRLDAETAIFSNLLKLDYAYAKVIDDTEETLASWNHLTTNPLKVPQVGDFVNIIQHPLGQKKQIALTRNDVIRLDNHKLFYKTDTEKGSSGAPVFDEEWNVIALHHAGKTEEEGGIIVDRETGERRGANEGILIKYVLEDIERQLKGED